MVILMLLDSPPQVSGGLKLIRDCHYFQGIAGLLFYNTPEYSVASFPGLPHMSEHSLRLLVWGRPGNGASILSYGVSLKL